MHVAARHHADLPVIEVAEDVPLVSGGIFSTEPRWLPVASPEVSAAACLHLGEAAGFWRGAALRDLRIGNKVL